MADDDDDHSEDNLGPALAACTPIERKFVRALFDDAGGRGAYGRAAKAAGYSASSTSNLSRAANKLRHRPRVIAAIQELAKLEIRRRAPDAVRTVADVMKRGKPADRLKAARTVLERVDPAETRHAVDLTVREETHKDLAVRFLEQLITMGTPREGLVEYFGYSGISIYEQKLREKCGREGRPYPTSKVIEHQPSRTPEGEP